MIVVSYSELSQASRSDGLCWSFQNPPKLWAQTKPGVKESKSNTYHNKNKYETERRKTKRSRSRTKKKNKNQMNKRNKKIKRNKKNKKIKKNKRNKKIERQKGKKHIRRQGKPTRSIMRRVTIEPWRTTRLPVIDRCVHTALNQAWESDIWSWHTRIPGAYKNASKSYINKWIVPQLTTRTALYALLHCRMAKVEWSILKFVLSLLEMNLNLQ